MINRGGRPLANPTVKIWLPPDVTRVSLGGDLLMRRNATVTGIPEDGTCLISVSRLVRNEERVIKLRVEARQPVRAQAVFSDRVVGAPSTVAQVAPVK